MQGVQRVNELALDLSKQQRNYFENCNPNIVNLQSINFIFGKNGSGKSTLTELIKEQFDQLYDVRVFTGFEDILVDDRLSAVVLGRKNIQVSKKINQLSLEIDELSITLEDKNNKLKSLEWRADYTQDGLTKDSFLENYEVNQEKVYSQKNKVEDFCRDQARLLKNKTNPQITETSYNLQSYNRDIKKAIELPQSDYQANVDLVKHEKKAMLSMPIFRLNNLANLQTRTNELLEFQIQEITELPELSTDARLKSFASKGLDLHKPGDKCAFCGNIVTSERLAKLDSYFSASDIRRLQDQVSSLLSEIQITLDQLAMTKLFSASDVYSQLADRYAEIKISFLSEVNAVKEYLNILQTEMTEKQKNIFEIRKGLTLEVPHVSEKLMNSVEKLIIDNNKITNNYSTTQLEAKEKLRFHEVAKSLKITTAYKKDWKGYSAESQKIVEFQSVANNSRTILNDQIEKLKGQKNDGRQDTLLFLQQEIDRKNYEAVELMKETQSTSELTRRINAKLYNAGKKDLQLKLVEETEDEVEHYEIENNGKVRPVKCLSTGEQNVIAFLYFIECLSTDELNNKPKIVIFDDPVNSNDDTMQYLIITELIRLYQGNKNKGEKSFTFNKDRDFFLCLTHNAHFFL